MTPAGVVRQTGLPHLPTEGLRRFQYRITAGLPVEQHLGTTDVREDGDGALAVYSTEIRPDALADVMGPWIERGVPGLKRHLEGPS